MMHRALDLRADAIRIDGRPAVDGHVDPRNGHIALLVDRHFHDRRDIGHEAAVDGDAEPVALRQLAAPARLLGYELDDAAQPPGSIG